VTKAPDAWLHGQDGPIVIVSAHVAAYLKKAVPLDKLRLAARDMQDAEVYNVLSSLHRAALAYNPTGDEKGVDSIPTPSPTLTTRQAATQLHLSPRGVRDACEKGRLAGELVDGRWRISRASVQRYTRNQQP
jgi:excisionase family DNA binding protein